MKNEKLFMGSGMYGEPNNTKAEDSMTEEQEKLTNERNETIQKGYEKGKEKGLTTRAEVMVSNNPEIQKSFDLILNSVLEGSGSLTITRQQGDGFPGPVSVICISEGWKMYMEIGKNYEPENINISSEISYMPEDEKDVNKRLEKLYEELDDRPGDANIMNEIDVIEGMIRIKDLSEK